jgi:O-antigen ligase
VKGSAPKGAATPRRRAGARPPAAAAAWAGSLGAAAERRSVGVLLIRLGAALVGAATFLSWWASPDRLAGLPGSVVALTGAILVLLPTGPWLAALSRKVLPRHIAWFFLVSGFIALLAALLTSRWPAYKLGWLGPVYSALPSIRSFSWAGQGLQPNQTGGFLAVCAALAAVVAASPSSPRRRRWAAFTLAVVGPIVVFMTGSRAALAGLVVVYLAILVVRTRRYLLAWAAGVVVAAVGLFATAQASHVVGFFLHDEGLDTKLASRLDIWSSALRGIGDHFFTGIGLGVFNQVVPARYPYHVVGLSFPVSQAHNLFLDVTLAIGFPGLVGFALLLAGTLILAVRCIGNASATGPIALGILGSLAVYLVFGITDSISLSVPTSFIVWLWSFSLIVLYEMGLKKAPDT